MFTFIFPSKILLFVAAAEVGGAAAIFAANQLNVDNNAALWERWLRRKGVGRRVQSSSERGMTYSSTKVLILSSFANVRLKICSAVMSEGIWTNVDH